VIKPSQTITNCPACDRSPCTNTTRYLLVANSVLCTISSLCAVRKAAARISCNCIVDSVPAEVQASLQSERRPTQFRITRSLAMSVEIDPQELAFQRRCICCCARSWTDGNRAVHLGMVSQTLKIRNANHTPVAFKVSSP